MKVIQFSAALLVSTLVLAGCSSKSSTPASSPSSSVSATGEASGTANPQVVTLLKKGIQQAQAGQLDQATTTFNNVLTLEPNNKYAFYNLGLVAQTKKDTQGAITNYDKAIASDPNYTPAMYNKAILLEGTDLKGAVALYEKIVGINPKASTAWYRLSLAYSKQGDKAKAADAMAKAVALDPSLGTATSASPSASPSR